MMAVYTERTGCRVCHGTLRDVLDLGLQALSAFVRPDEPAPPRAPLVLARCDTCGLVQLRHTVKPDFLYRKYWYRSGINETMRGELRRIVASALRIVPTTARDVVVDIGANDGTLLAAYGEGAYRVAFEPARNLASLAAASADLLIPEYFSGASADRLAGRPKAKIVTAIAMAYDLDDPLTFFRDVATILAHDGLCIVQMSNLVAMIDSRAYDVICHEHLLTWDRRSFAACLNAAGLAIHGVTASPINGGSARYYIGHADAPPSLRARLADEAPLAIGERDISDADLATFADTAVAQRACLRSLMANLHDQGSTVFGLAASTKFNTVLQYCDIGPSWLPAIADRDPRKAGLVTPNGIPIIGEAEARKRQPDVYVVGAWQFLESLRERESVFLDHGGQFLVPFPSPYLTGSGTRTSVGVGVPA